MWRRSERLSRISTSIRNWTALIQLGPISAEHSPNFRANFIIRLPRIPMVGRKMAGYDGVTRAVARADLRPATGAGASHRHSQDRAARPNHHPNSLLTRSRPKCSFLLIQLAEEAP